MARRWDVAAWTRLRSIAGALALASALAVGSSPTSLLARDIEIVGDPRPSGAGPIDLGRRFGAAPCAPRPPAKTMLDVLRPDAEKILVHQFDARQWRDLDAVRTYVGRVLSAEPEGRALSPGVYWAEMRQVEIIASVEFSSGRRGPLHLANGYAHVQDSAGCEWWARYLGPDRSTWVVWP